MLCALKLNLIKIWSLGAMHRVSCLQATLKGKLRMLWMFLPFTYCTCYVCASQYNQTGLEQ